MKQGQRPGRGLQRPSRYPSLSDEVNGKVAVLEDERELLRGQPETPLFASRGTLFRCMCRTNIRGLASKSPEKRARVAPSPVFYRHRARGALVSARAGTMSDALLEAVRGLWLVHPELGPKPLLAKLRQQQPDLGGGNKEVREALTALKALDSKATEAAAVTPPAAAAAVATG